LQRISFKSLARIINRMRTVEAILEEDANWKIRNLSDWLFIGQTPTDGGQFDCDFFA